MTAITPVIVIAGQIAPAITVKLHWNYGTITVKFALPGFRNIMYMHFNLTEFSDYTSFVMVSDNHNMYSLETLC